MSANDDIPVGRILTRREALFLLGAAALAPLDSAFALPAESCVVLPEQTEGPFFFDKQLNRSDIRSDPATGTISAGVPLDLAILVRELKNGVCAPLPGAIVDVWHSDAQGVYSGVGDAEAAKFLRGYQVADATGAVRFSTIYPGWYPWRTVHIHIKIRTAPAADAKPREFSSQIYFPDEISDAVFRLSPYQGRGERKERNTDDVIFKDGGDQLMLRLAPREEGYSGSISFTLASR